MKKYSDKWLRKHGWNNFIEYYFWMVLAPRTVFSKKPFWRVSKRR